MPTPSKHVKFVASDPSRGGLPVKRKQVQHACASCRKKKRRCVHAEDAVDETSPPVEEDETSRSTTALPDSSLQYANPTANASPAAPTPRRESGSTPNQSSRFVGDLNPEGMFMEATGSASIRETSQKGDVGIWLSSNNPGQASQFITSRPPPIMDQFLLPFVKEHCLSCLPPHQDYLKLKALYLEKIHPIMPIIPETALQGDEPVAVVLKQLICLAASADPSMALYLHLQNKGDDLLPCQDFMQSLSSAVRAILETSIITDRVLHIRALILLSLYTQPNSSEEADLPAQLGGRAIHHIQTLGLHLLRYDGPNSEELETLFCAVWAVDRINAAVYGRPCVMHERDIGANLDGCISKRPPCFRLFLSVVQWLDQVIELYRPGPSAEASGLDKIAYIDLPVLEAMIVNADALKVPGSLIATIETFYHAVIILSCRLPRPGTLTAASTLPPPSANARRSLAAERIACAVLRDHLSPMPFVPYAVCLALSVEYRKMRHSRLPMFRSRAMHAFRRNCEMLRKFGDYFWSANVVAGLGERVLKEMERAANTLTRESPPPAPVVVNPVAVTNPSMVNAVPSVEQAVDFSLIDAISGADVFGAIDPNFNLGAVEDALEANLDIGLPMNWVDWGQYATLS
ncbi:transcription factor [Fusarium subglutinans]|uniref:Transcription factor n=1 Tax=Gibberella subglutinans TaxID=42677 RepID=A0A8H5QF51_GIBSU|nr:transcription factor [Fusarium subglutinans]KAF5613619.1 transcription factor [Fusarium subglutinans]